MGCMRALVFHADLPEAVGTLARCGRDAFDCTGLYLSGASPVMGAQAGPCALGVACSVDHEG